MTQDTRHGANRGDTETSESGNAAISLSRASSFRFPASSSAFSLVEVTMAMGVAAFCLISLFGLLPVGLNSNQVAVEQTVAAGFANAIVADLRASGTNAMSPTYSIPLTSGAPTFYLDESGGATAIGSGPNHGGAFPSRYRASVFITPPAAGQRAATTIRILMTWPASADPAPATAAKNYAGSYGILTALDRN